MQSIWVAERSSMQGEAAADAEPCCSHQKIKHLHFADALFFYLDNTGSNLVKVFA